MAARAQQARADVAERVVGLRNTPGGPGQQYEIKWRNQAETTWEAASRVRRQVPDLVKAFQQQQQQQQQQSENTQAAEGEETAADGSSMRAQLEAYRRLTEEQKEQIELLRAAAARPPQSITLPAQGRAGTSATTGPARKQEPRLSDLAEYDGAGGDKLDTWLDSLQRCTDYYEMPGADAVRFAAAHLRDTAYSWWRSLDATTAAAMHQNGLAAFTAALRARFQPVTAERVARGQLDKLLQGGRHVNDYIAEFHKLRARIPSMSDADALYAFERGLRADIARELRIQRVATLREATELAARVGEVALAHQTRAAAVNQMEADDG